MQHLDEKSFGLDLLRPYYAEVIKINKEKCQGKSRSLNA